MGARLVIAALGIAVLAAGAFAAGALAGAASPALRRLTTEAALEAMPAWSADGRRIVFHSRRPPEDARRLPTRKIWARPAAGGEAVRLSDGIADEYHPAISPDGRKIVFVSEGSGSRDVWVMGADGSNPVPLTDDPGLEDHPAWSPDGKRIAYVALPKEGGNLDLWVMNDDGSARRKLTFTAANEVFPAWHPNGRTIAFATDAQGAFDVHGLGLDDERTFPILTSPDHETRPAWSPDGTRLAFARWAVGESGDAARIWIANADGTLPTDVGLPPGSTHPVWSPAGSELAFQRRVEGGWEIWTARLPAELLAGARLDLARVRRGATHDVVRLRGGERLAGNLAIRTLGLRTSYGRLSLPAPQIATIEFAGLERGTARVMLSNGDTFNGFLAHETLVIAGPGGRRTLRVEGIERIELRSRAADALRPAAVRLSMRNGDSFGARLRSPALRLRIGGQHLELPFRDVSRIDFGEVGQKSRILTRKGETLTATIETPLLGVDPAAGGPLDLHPASILSLTRTETSP